MRCALGSHTHTYTGVQAHGKINGKGLSVVEDRERQERVGWSLVTSQRTNRPHRELKIY